MGRLITGVTCPRCLRPVVNMGSGGLVDVFYLCEHCGRHWERMEVDLMEVDTDSGEVIEWTAVHARVEHAETEAVIPVPTDVEWQRCRLCGGQAALIQVAGGGLAVVNPGGSLHRRSCDGIARNLAWWNTFDADRYEAELAGQLRLPIGVKEN